MDEKVLLDFITYLLSQRNQLEFDNFNLKRQLENATKKQGADQSQGTLGSRELHQSDTPNTTPWTVS